MESMIEICADVCDVVWWWWGGGDCQLLPLPLPWSVFGQGQNQEGNFYQ